MFNVYICKDREVSCQNIHNNIHMFIYIWRPTMNTIYTCSHGEEEGLSNHQRTRNLHAHILWCERGPGSAFFKWVEKCACSRKR